MRARLEKLAGARLTKDGVVVIFADRFRTQERNRADALERLLALIRRAAEVPKPRRPTRPTAASKERRLKGKSERSGVKQLRGRPRSTRTRLRRRRSALACASTLQAPGPAKTR